MAKLKKFITASIEPTGRKSLVMGEKVETRFKNDSFEVSYDYQPGTVRKPERLTVTVVIRDHGTASWQCMGILPSAVTARLHAGTAFRTHFGVGSGDPADFKDGALARLVDGCPCIPA